jgi:hypothetical protein
MIAKEYIMIPIGQSIMGLALLATGHCREGFQSNLK